VLEAEQPLPVDELVTRTGAAERTVKSALKALGAEAVAGPHGRRFWSLPE
jgi:hypothetical protein